MTRPCRKTGLVGPVVVLGVVGVLVVAGRGALAAPPVGSFDDFTGWLDDTDTVTAALALLRLGALGVAAWLLAVLLLGAVGRAFGWGRLVAATDRVVPAPLRQVLTGLAGLGAASVVVLGGSGAGAHDHGGAVPVGERLVLLPADGEATATMSVLPATDGAPAPASPPVPAAPATWTVAPGDSFWSIAEEVLTDGWGRPPTDAEIDPYWRRLIEANRDRITSGNADLIFPGQVFVLPAA